MPYETLIPLIVLLPILGFAFTALFGRRLQMAYGRRAANAVPVLGVIAVWVIAMVVVAGALGRAEAFGETGLDVKLWTWIPADKFSVDLGFHVDTLTAALLIVVTTIGMLVHIYSIGYMAHDPGTWRFFAYLNLFMFSMLLLVLANNWLLVFAGLGAGRAVVVPADRVLVPQAIGGSGRQEGVHRQPRRATSDSRSGSWRSSSTPGR